MKLEIKETYVVDGIQYSSLTEAKVARNRNVEPIDDEQKRNNFSMIPIYERDVSELVFYQKTFKNLSLLEVIELRQQISNEKYRFVLPTYSEIKAMEKINRFPYDLPESEYWTSTRFLYNTYISYDSGKRKFNDIYPQYKADCFFLIKENKEGSWFFDPPIKNSISELIYLQEKERGKIVHSY
jgi:hypothetical protein